MASFTSNDPLTRSPDQTTAGPAPAAEIPQTREPQYQRSIDIVQQQGLTSLGLMTNQAWQDDPKHLLFTLARYKFAAKMLSGRSHVLEVGCADAFGTRLVLQEVKQLTATDFDPTFVDDVHRRMDLRWSFACVQHDLLSGPFPGRFDGAYALDVIEHIPSEKEDLFVGNIVRSLSNDGVLILGCPSIQSQSYASPPSKAGHVNCKDGKGLKDLLSRFFHNVFVFSMNDEVVHTGYYPMAHYLIGIGCTPRDRASLSSPDPTAMTEPSLKSGQPASKADDRRAATVDLSIVVPCLNEERNIVPTLDTIVAAMQEVPQYSYEVLVVDDGSTDRTAEKVLDYQRLHPEVEIALRRNPSNYGLTRTYVDTAFVGRGAYYRLVCGDNVEPKETLVEVFRRMGEADMVIPYHLPVPGKSAFRRRLSNLYTTLVNNLSGHNIHYYNGLALHLRYNVMRWGPYSFGFGFQAELITRLLDEGATYVEIPVRATHNEKPGANSALNWRNFLSVGHTLLEVFIRRLRKRAFRRSK